MATLSVKFSFRKPAPADVVNVQTDINDSMDKIDLALGEKRRYRKTDGDMALANNVTNPVTGAGTTTADLALKAVVGDWVEASLSGQFQNQGFVGLLDVWSRLAGTPVNSWGGNNWAAPVAGHQGVPGWRGEASAFTDISGSVIRQIVAGDIDATGLVTMTPYGNGLGGPKYISATAAIPFTWHVINHGQP